MIGLGPSEVFSEPQIMSDNVEKSDEKRTDDIEKESDKSERESDKRDPLYIEEDQNREDEDVVEEGRMRRAAANNREKFQVDFVSSQGLKDELMRQPEDPSNPFKWLTSYSRIPVSLYFTFDICNYHSATTLDLLVATLYLCF